jgi:amino acid transporter
MLELAPRSKVERILTTSHAVMSIGWIVVSFFTLLVAIAMAEVVSAIPTSGGPYFWSAMLAPPRWSPFAAWLTGWYNLLGQVIPNPPHHFQPPPHHHHH